MYNRKTKSIVQESNNFLRLFRNEHLIGDAMARSAGGVSSCRASCRVSCPLTGNELIQKVGKLRKQREEANGNDERIKIEETIEELLSKQKVVSLLPFIGVDATEDYSDPSCTSSAIRTTALDIIYNKIYTKESMSRGEEAELIRALAKIVEEMGTSESLVNKKQESYAFKILSLLSTKEL